MNKELCDICLRRRVDCGIRKFRRFPWQECRHFREDENETPEKGEKEEV